MRGKARLAYQGKGVLSLFLFLLFRPDSLTSSLFQRVGNSVYSVSMLMRRRNYTIYSARF